MNPVKCSSFRLLACLTFGLVCSSPGNAADDALARRAEAARSTREFFDRYAANEAAAAAAQSDIVREFLKTSGLPVASPCPHKPRESSAERRAQVLQNVMSGCGGSNSSQTLYSTSDKELEFFLAIYGERMDCPSGCFQKTIIGMRYGTKVGWIEVNDLQRDQSSKALTYKLNESDEYLFGSDLLGILRELPGKPKDYDLYLRYLYFVAESLNVSQRTKVQFKHLIEAHFCREPTDRCKNQLRR